ncbi:MAG TPA: YciI family protein [Solirubrobacteraceae bacterium]|nr:YciI family protein [Solirubrobacteraceae bacterium]
MNYLLLICTDGVSTPEIAAAMQEHTPKWVDEMDSRGVRLLGNGLQGRDSAKTVRVRDGRTLITDGPFADSKEFIGGLDIIAAESLDEAIEVAAKHPVSWYFSIEVRPFRHEVAVPENWTYEQLRYLMLPCLDGIPEPAAVEERLLGDLRAWAEMVDARGVRIVGAPLAPASTATMVRVRDGETLLSDGPFVETKEYVAGIDILSCETLEEALELAAAHPLSHVHMVEVRPFWGA